MSQAEDLFLRYHQGLPYVARVTVQVQPDPSGPRILLDCVGTGFSSQGSAEEATTTGCKDWKQGAEAGARHALRTAAQEQSLVFILRINGLSTDTNPTIVGAAAMKAVWQALGYSPFSGEVERIEQIVLGSWQQPYDFIPDFAAAEGGSASFHTS